MTPPCQAGRGVVRRDDRSKTRSVAPRHRAFLDQVYLSVEAAVRDKQLGRRPSPSRRHPWGVAGKPASPELVGLFATAIRDEIGGKTEVHTVPGAPRRTIGVGFDRNDWFDLRLSIWAMGHRRLGG
jgi:hypothetical protein